VIRTCVDVQLDEILQKKEFFESLSTRTLQIPKTSFIPLEAEIDARACSFRCDHSFSHIPLNLLFAFLIPMSSSKTKETVVDKALHYFNVEGWNCAESVYMAIFRDTTK